MDNVLITGANRGLGAALAKEFAAHGFGLVLNARSPFVPDQEIAESVKEIVFGDVTDIGTIYELGEAAERQSIKILVNNAGIYNHTPFDKVTFETLRLVIETNLIAPMLLTKAVWHVLQEVGGAVVNINSLAGHTGEKSEVAYCASKHGLAGFSKALQFAGTTGGIKVLNVYLAQLKTDMSTHRPEWENHIDPYEAASVMVRLCKDWKSLRITEINITRNRYASRTF